MGKVKEALEREREKDYAPGRTEEALERNPPGDAERNPSTAEAVPLPLTREAKGTGQKIPVPTEGEEQATLFNWAKMQLWKWPELEMMYHIPNGGTRKKSEAARFKAEGVKKGVPDICLPIPRGAFHGLYIELKRQKGGRVSEEQEDWLRKLTMQGYRAVSCWGWKEAAEEISAYMSK